MSFLVVVVAMVPSSSAAAAAACYAGLFFLPRISGKRPSHNFQTIFQIKKCHQKCHQTLPEMPEMPPNHVNLYHFGLKEPLTQPSHESQCEHGPFLMHLR